MVFPWGSKVLPLSDKIVNTFSVNCKDFSHNGLDKLCTNCLLRSH